MGFLAPLLLEDVSSTIDRNHERSSTRTYTGYCTLDCDENFVRTNVLVGPNTPPVKITDQHPTDAFQFVTNINVGLAEKQPTTFIDDSANQLYAVNNGTRCYYWRVVIEFGPFNPLEQSVSGTMLDIPTRYRWEPEDNPKPIFQDYSNESEGDDNLGNPILNAAGDYFNPGIERLYSKRRLTVLRNEANVDWPTLQKNEYCTNDAPWNGYDKDMVLFKPVRSGVQKFTQVNGSYYNEMEYSFEIKLETWKAFILNSGYKKLVDGKQEVIKDEYGQPVSDPVPLDEDGTPLPQPISPSDLVLLEFQLYKHVDFSFLDMDDLFTTGVGS